MNMEDEIRVLQRAALRIALGLFAVALATTIGMWRRDAHVARLERRVTVLETRSRDPQRTVDAPYAVETVYRALPPTGIGR